MINITITGQVTNSEKEKIEIKIDGAEIEELIRLHAIKAGIVGYQGRIFEHLDEEIIKVEINN